MSSDHEYMYPRIAGYMGVAKHIEKLEKRPPPATVNGLIWAIGTSLEAGVYLAGHGRFACDIAEIEALMADRSAFQGSIHQRAERAIQGVLLVFLGDSAKGSQR